MKLSTSNLQQHPRRLATLAAASLATLAFAAAWAAGAAEPPPGEPADDPVFAALLRIDPSLLDEYSVRSHERAAKAQAAGDFEAEITPITTAAGTVDADEGIRPGSSVEKLATLKAPFIENGVITAGNASQISDGAAALLLARVGKALEPFGVKPEAMAPGRPGLAKAKPNAGHHALSIWAKATTDDQIRYVLGNMNSDLTLAGYGTYSAVYSGTMEPQAARAQCIAYAEARINGEHLQRWISHKLNRLSFEREMLGTVARYTGSCR